MGIFGHTVKRNHFSNIYHLPDPTHHLADIQLHLLLPLQGKEAQ